MSKVVRAVNAMVANPSKISEAQEWSGEMYFKYNDKHKWSIWEDKVERRFVLNFYPGQQSLETIASSVGVDLEAIARVTYTTDDFKTREAFESFSELYRVVKEKLHGVDKALDDIIESNEDDLPF